MNVNSTEMSGALIINKPQGITSHDVVGKIRKRYKTRQVGHTGTLDPLATGVLIVLVGSAVKASELMMAEKKRYIATLKLGVTSDTEDITGKLEYSNCPIPNKDEVLTVINSFKGNSQQIPPMYSAIKINGKKLVDIARNGGTIDRPSREITIFSISGDGDGDTFRIDVECSKGTYIRTLCADIGKKLGCGAVMATLERVSVGSFSIEESHTIEEIEAMNDEDLHSILISRENLVSGIDDVHLSDFYSKLCINGCEIYQKKIHTDYPLGTLVRLYGTHGFMGIGEVMDYSEGTAIKLQIRL